MSNALSPPTACITSTFELPVPAPPTGAVPGGITSTVPVPAASVPAPAPASTTPPAATAASHSANAVRPYSSFSAGNASSLVSKHKL